MKKIIIALMSVMITVGLVGIGTYAIFSDTETSLGNTFTAGTLDVKIDWEDDPKVFAFNFDNMKPGDKGYHTFRIHNEGTLPGTLTISVGPYTEAGGLNPEPEIVEEGEGNIPNLDNELYILMCRDNDCDPWCEGDMLLTNLDGKVSDELSQTDPTDVYTYSLGAGHQICVTLCYEVQDADYINMIMGDSVVFDIEFALEQEQP